MGEENIEFVVSHRTDCNCCGWERNRDRYESEEKVYELKLGYRNQITSTALCENHAIQLIGTIALGKQKS